MAGIVALLFFAFVVVTTVIVFSILASAFDRYEQQYASSGARQLGEMFLFVTPRQIVVLNMCLVALLGIFGYLLSGGAATLLFGALGLVAPTFLIRFYRRRRVQKIEAQLVDGLDQIAGALRAGLSFQQALEAVSKEAQSPLRQELSLMLREVRINVSLDEALVNLASRVGSGDLWLVVTSANICRKLGGNMSEMFETIASTIRERFRIDGKIRSLTAMGKAQGWVVGSMPLGVGVALYYMRPDLMIPFLGSMFGWTVIAVIVTLELLGMLVIRRIVTIDI